MDQISVLGSQGKFQLPIKWDNMPSGTEIHLVLPVIGGVLSPNVPCNQFSFRDQIPSGISRYPRLS